jgi:hypothetical protein
MYDTAPCQETGTCEEFDVRAYSSEVELYCYGAAFDFCVGYGDVDQCWREVVDQIRARADLSAREFPSGRVTAAAELQNGFLSSGLLRALGRRQSPRHSDCPELAEMLKLQEVGLKRETFCSGFEAMNMLDNEQDIANRTVKLETENQ